MSNYYYKAYGLTIQSEFECETLEIIDPQKTDITIQNKTLNHSKNTRGIRGGPAHIHYHVPNLATFDVSNGKAVYIEVDNNINEEFLSSFITGSALGIILHQRGFLLLHGNAIAISDSEAVIFVGPSGAGKSTTANAFLQAGYEILTDDVSAIEFDNNGNAWVVPSYPSIKLWEDVAKHDYDLTTLQPIASREKKYYVQTDTKFCGSKRKVTAIYGLAINQRVEEQALNIPPIEWLRQQIYLLPSVGLLEKQERCFIQLLQLLKTVGISTLARPLNYKHTDLIKLVTSKKKEKAQ